MKDLVRLGEKTLIIVGLLYLTETFYRLFPSPVLSGLQYSFYGLIFLLLLARWQRTLITITYDPFLWGLLVLSLCSFAWSNFPNDSLIDSIVAWQTASVGLYLASCYNLKQQLRFMGWTFAIIVVLNFFYTLALPDLGVDLEEHIGAWRGVYSHKNVLSQIVTFGSLVFLLLSTIVRRYKYLIWAGLGSSVGLILLSTSKTALIILISLFLLLRFYKALRWRDTKAILLLIIVALTFAGVIVVLVGNAEFVLDKLGRDITLSGRTQIWHGVIEKIQQRPLFGYGRSAFWHPDSGMGIAIGGEVSLNYVVAHSHNGFIDLTAELGLVGLSLFLSSLFIAFKRAYNLARLTITPENLWPLMYLSFFCLYNLTEHSIMVHNSALWATHVAVALSLGRISHARSSQQSQPKTQIDKIPMTQTNIL